MKKVVCAGLMLLPILINASDASKKDISKESLEKLFRALMAAPSIDTNRDLLVDNKRLTFASLVETRNEQGLMVARVISYDNQNEDEKRSHLGGFLLSRIRYEFQGTVDNRGWCAGGYGSWSVVELSLKPLAKLFCCGKKKKE